MNDIEKEFANQVSTSEFIIGTKFIDGMNNYKKKHYHIPYLCGKSYSLLMWKSIVIKVKVKSMTLDIKQWTKQSF